MNDRLVNLEEWRKAQRELKEWKKRNPRNKNSVTYRFRYGIDSRRD
jgi:hypothetical protein